MKSRTILLAAAYLTICLVGPARAQQTSDVPPHEAVSSRPAAPAIGAAAGILLDATAGKILWAKDDKTPRPPASLTKILTALVVLKNGRLTDSTTISEAARFAPGGRTYAEQGWSFTVEELLWGLLLQSGNDAAVALAEKVSPDGTVPGFMKMANKMAKDIGATDTNMVNPHGYDEPGHLTTARDLALITFAAMKDPVFAQMVATKAHDVKWGDGQPHTFINHNKLLNRYEGAIGVKTGFTGGAGHCLVSAVERDGNRLIAVVMGSPDHYAESIALYDWGFANLEALRAEPVGVIQPRTAQRQAPATANHGLEVVQLDPKDVAMESKTETESPASAPLVVPLFAGAFSVWVGTRIIRSRRRRQRSFSMMDELHHQLDNLGSRVTYPDPVGPSSSV